MRQKLNAMTSTMGIQAPTWCRITPRYNIMTAVMRLGWHSGLPPAGQVVEVWYSVAIILPCGRATNGAPQTGNGWTVLADGGLGSNGEETALQ